MTSDIPSSHKVCFKCGACLPRSEFYKHPKMADGLLGKCKTCTKADVSANRAKNIERVRAYDRARAKLPHRLVFALQQQAQRRELYKTKTNCYSKVARALRAGVIKWQPCCVCGSEQSLAHHESYLKPLDVVWYCQVHHMQRHKEMAALGITP